MCSLPTGRLTTPQTVLLHRCGVLLRVFFALADSAYRLCWATVAIIEGNLSRGGRQRGALALRHAHPPAYLSMHRQGPLRGRLVPQPWSFRAGRPECLAWFAFAGILRMLFRFARPSVTWGSAYPPAARAPRFAWAPCGRPDGRPAATLVACGRYAPAAATVPLWSASRPFGSHRPPSRPLRCASCTGRGGVRLATLPARRYAAFRSLRDPA